MNSCRSRHAAAYIGCSAYSLRGRDRAKKLPDHRRSVSCGRLHLSSVLDEFLRKLGDTDKKAAAEGKLGRNLSKTRSRKHKG